MQKEVIMWNWRCAHESIFQDFYVPQLLEIWILPEALTEQENPVLDFFLFVLNKTVTLLDLSETLREPLAPQYLQDAQWNSGQSAK